MTNYLLHLFGENMLWVLFLLAVSAVYYVNGNTLAPLKRMVISAHGLIFSLAIFFAIFVQEYTTTEKFQVALYSFYGLLLVGATFVVFSIIYYPGKKIIHLLQVPSIAIAFSYFIYGSFLIAHDSL